MSKLTTLASGQITPSRHGIIAIELVGTDLRGSRRAAGIDQAGAKAVTGLRRERSDGLDPGSESATAAARPTR
jgi:hypothetical protein